MHRASEAQFIGDEVGNPCKRGVQPLKRGYNINMHNAGKHLLRIKINGFNFLRVSLFKEKDFIFSFPQTKVTSYTLNGHFTLHTERLRITFKTTSIKKGSQEILPAVVNQYKDHPGIKGKVIANGEIDLNKGNDLNLEDPTKLIKTPIGIGLNLEINKIEDLFTSKVSKTPDDSFDHIEDIQLPEGKTGFYIHFLIGKNFMGNIADYIKEADYHFVIQRQNYCSDVYTLLLLMNYKFPKIKENNSALRI